MYHSYFFPLVNTADINKLRIDAQFLFAPNIIISRPLLSAFFEATLHLMKTINIFIALVLLMTTLPQITKAQGGISAGVRQHTLHSVFTELPFKDDDLTYTLGYEYHDKNGYWQFMVGYTPEIDNTEIEIGDIEVDYVITPQLNLVIRDGIFLAGTGILASYIESTEDSDWTDVYWQLMLGLEIPIGAIRLELLAYYPFDSWGNVDEFDSDDIEYGGSFKYLF